MANLDVIEVRDNALWVAVDGGYGEKQLLLHVSLLLRDAEVVVPDLHQAIFSRCRQECFDGRLVRQPGCLNVFDAAVLGCGDGPVLRMRDGYEIDLFELDVAEFAVVDAGRVRGEGCLRDVDDDGPRLGLGGGILEAERPDGNRKSPTRSRLCTPRSPSLV